MKESDLLPGTLGLLVLQVLARNELHGYAIAREIERLSGDALAVEQGSLYPALYRLERSGWIRARWSISETSRRVKVYALTTAGRRRLGEELANWESFVNAVRRVVRGTAP